MTEKQWQELTAALRDCASPGRAAEAAAALQAGASAQDVPRLIALLHDSDFVVREAAAWPLSDLGCTEALPDLVRAQRIGYDEGYDNDGLNAALAGLVSAHPDAARPTLLKLAESSDEGTSEAARWLMELCGHDV